MKTIECISGEEVRSKGELLVHVRSSSTRDNLDLLTDISRVSESEFVVVPTRKVEIKSLKILGVCCCQDHTGCMGTAPVYLLIKIVNYSCSR